MLIMLDSLFQKVAKQGPARAQEGPAGFAEFAGFAVMEGAGKEPVGVAFKPVRNAELSVILLLFEGAKAGQRSEGLLEGASKMPN